MADAAASLTNEHLFREQAADHGLRTIEVEAAALGSLHASLSSEEQRSAFNQAVDLLPPSLLHLAHICRLHL